MTITAGEVEGIDVLLRHLLTRDLSEWDRTFVEDIAFRIEAQGSLTVLSDRQREQLTRLEDQYPMAEEQFEPITDSSAPPAPPAEPAVAVAAASASTPTKPKTRRVVGGNVGVDGKKVEGVVQALIELDGEVTKLNGEKRDIFKSAKDGKLDVKAIRRLVAARKKGIEKFRAEEDTFDRYCLATGMLD